MNNLPDRWLMYTSMGAVIRGTRFVACKVPLKETMQKRLEEHKRFTPNDLMACFPKLGLVVDLTNTKRYYSPDAFTNKNIEYQKIFCPGRVVPPNSIVERFFAIVDEFLEVNKDSGLLIAVHCTHGVNRTGYFICRYMIQRLGFAPREAVKKFEDARGHEIERYIYVEDLKAGCKGGKESNLRFAQKIENGPRPAMDRSRMNTKNNNNNNNATNTAGNPAKKPKANRPENNIIRKKKNQQESRSKAPIKPNKKSGIICYFNKPVGGSYHNKPQSSVQQFDGQSEERDRSPSPVILKFTWKPLSSDEEDTGRHQMHQPPIIHNMPPAHIPPSICRIPQPPPPGYPLSQAHQIPQPPLINQMSADHKPPQILRLRPPPLLQTPPPGYPLSQAHQIPQPPLTNQMSSEQQPPQLHRQRRPPLLQTPPPGTADYQPPSIHRNQRTALLPTPPLINQISPDHQTAQIHQQHRPHLLPTPPGVNQISPDHQTPQIHQQHRPPLIPQPPLINQISQRPPGHYPRPRYQALPGYRIPQNRPPPFSAWKPRSSHPDASKSKSSSQTPFSQGYRRVYTPQARTPILSTNSKSPEVLAKAGDNHGPKGTPGRGPFRTPTTDKNEGPNHQMANNKLHFKDR